MKRRRLMLVLALVLISSMVLFAAGSQEMAAEDDYKLVLRLSHVVSPAEQLTIPIDEVSSSIYEKTNGAI